MIKQTTKVYADKTIACMLALLLVASSVFIGTVNPKNAYAASDSLSEASWDEVKDDIEALMGTPYVFGGRSLSGWDCSGFVSYVMHDIYGTGWPGGSWGNAGTGQIEVYCSGYEVLYGSSADDYNDAYDNGTVKAGDIIIFSNSSGETVHAAIAGENQTIYHAYSENYGTCNMRFDQVWGYDGGHGKTYSSFVVYRGLSEGGYVTLTKTSADIKVSRGNENYSLEGAVYGIYQNGALVAQVTTDASGNGKTTDKLKNGTYTVKEISSPKGYALNDKEYTAVIKGADTHVNVVDEPVTVNLILVKQDSETMQATPQGSASLDGAEYKASYQYDGQTKVVYGTTVDGKISFNGIPLGDVLIEETKAPEGYLPDTTKHLITVTDEMAGRDKVVFRYMPENEFTEQVKRGDLELVKAGDSTFERMANVPFKITSKTTGESHVIVTDANGYASTASSWNPHSQDTNGATSESGIWFGEGTVNDDKGALIYDTYTIEELPCEANADKELIPAFEVQVYRDGVTIELGTLLNEGKTPTVISKVDVTTQEELPGATLQVIDADGNVVEEWVSSDTPYNVYLEPGTYVLHEEIAPDGYLVASDVEFTVADGNVVQTVVMEDDYTKVEISKVDIATGEALPGATLQIIDSEGNVVEEWITTEEPYLIERLAPGEYTLHEVEAPEGYEVAEDVAFTVEATGEIQKVTMEDKAIEVTETLEEPDEPKGDTFDKTGFDMTQLTAVVIVLAIGAGGCLAYAMHRSRKRDEEELEEKDSNEEI